MRRLRIALLLVGGGGMVYLVARTGLAALAQPFAALSWGLVPVVVLPYLLATVLHAAGWRLAFLRGAPPLARLASVRVAGEAFNVLAGSVGGEPVKVGLLRPPVALDVAVTAVVVDKTTTTLGQVVFLGGGLLIAHAAFSLPRAFLQAYAWLLAVAAVGVTGFLLVQAIGMGEAIVRILRWLGWPALARRAEPVLRIERGVATFYRAHPGRCALATGWHVLGWMAGSLEVYLVLWLLGRDVSLAGVVVVEAFTAAVRFAAFMVPAALGALEVGSMVVFEALGLGAGLGLSLSLIRRLRQLVWVGVGLLCVGALGGRRPLR